MPRPTHHYLRPNTSESTPDRVAVLDVETYREVVDGQVRLPFRLGYLKLVRRHGVDPQKPREENYPFYALGSLMPLLNGICESGKPLQLYAHNAATELEVTQLPLLAESEGWEFTSGNLAFDPVCARWARGSKCFWLKDSFSWLPTSVYQLGRLVGLPKYPLPDWDAPDEHWMERCERDVEITARALIQCMDYCDREHLGNWGPTGPTTGMASYKHCYVQHPDGPRLFSRTWLESDEWQNGSGRVLISPPGHATGRARAALHGGLRSTSMQGTLPHGSYGELDFKRAHLTVAAHKRLPCRLLGHRDSIPLDDPMLDDYNYGLIAEVEIETEVPRYPVRTPDGTIPPRGRFWTTLASPLIDEARRRGELRSIGPADVYQMSYHMADWARWLGAQLDSTGFQGLEAVPVMLKGWARSVPAKWAQRTSKSELIGTAPTPAFKRVDLVPEPGRPPQVRLQVGTKVFLVTHDLEPDNGFPAVLAFIQAWTMLDLGRVADAIGPASMISVNTDSVVFWMRHPLVDPAQAKRVIHEPPASWQELKRLGEEISIETEVLTPLPKGLYGRLRVFSGQHHLVDDDRRMAGLPARAEEIPGRPGVFKGEVWARLGELLKDPDRQGLKVQEREFDFRDVAINGLRFDCGHVEPPRCAVGPDRQTRVLAPAHTCPRCRRGRLRPHQWPIFLAASGSLDPRGP